jgi:hypothetical protein
MGGSRESLKFVHRRSYAPLSENSRFRPPGILPCHISCWLQEWCIARRGNRCPCPRRPTRRRWPSLVPGQTAASGTGAKLMCPPNARLVRNSPCPGNSPIGMDALAADHDYPDIPIDGKVLLDVGHMPVKGVGIPVIVVPDQKHATPHGRSTWFLGNIWVGKKLPNL